MMGICIVFSLVIVLAGLWLGRHEGRACITPVEQQVYHEADADKTPAITPHPGCKCLMEPVQSDSELMAAMRRQINEVLAAIEERNREAEWK